MFSESKINIKMKTSLLMLCMIITYTQGRCIQQRSYSGDQAITTCKRNTSIPPEKDNEIKESPELVSHRSETFFIGGENDAAVTKKSGGSGPLKNNDTTNRDIQKPITPRNNGSIKRYEKEDEEDKELVLSRQVREFEEEKKAAKLAGKPFRSETFFIGGENDAAVTKASGGSGPLKNNDTTNRDIQKPITPRNNKSIKRYQKGDEEDKELVLSRQVREFEEEKKAAKLAGKPFRSETFFIGGENDAAVTKASGGSGPLKNNDTTNRDIQKPITPRNNKSIKINQKEVEEDKELALAREVREFEKEMKAAELAGKPYRRQTFFIGGENDAAVTKESGGSGPLKNNDTTNRDIQKPITPRNNGSIKRYEKEDEEDKELVLSRQVREFEEEKKAAKLAGKPFRSETFFIGGENYAAVTKESGGSGPLKNNDTTNRDIQKPITPRNNGSIKRYEKEDEEDKELVLSRQVREFEEEKKAAKLAGKPYRRQTFFIGGENDAAVTKESGGSGPLKNNDTTNRDIQKPITPRNNGSIKRYEKEDEEDKELVLSRQVREFEEEKKAAKLAGKPFRSETFFIGGENDAAVTKESGGSGPLKNNDTTNRDIQKPITPRNNGSIKRYEKEDEEDKELVLSRQVREFEEEKKAAKLAGKPFRSETFFIGGENDAAVTKASGGSGPLKNNDTTNRDIQKPITPRNNKSIKRYQKGDEEDKELVLSRQVREFEEEKKAAKLAGKPFRSETFFIGGENDAAVTKASGGSGPLKNNDTTNRDIQKPITPRNNKSIKINQKEVEEDKELALAREVREFEKEMKAAELAGKPYRRQTFFIGGENDAAVTKESGGSGPLKNNDTTNRDIQKPITPRNNRSIKRYEKEDEEDKELVLSRQVRKFEEEKKAAKLAGKPFRSETFFIGGENDAAVTKESGGSGPLKNNDTTNRDIQKPITPRNNKSTNTNISNREIANNNNNMGRCVKRNVKPNGRM